MKILGVIPSRYASSRFPGKPLVDIGGKTMIRRVYDQALKSHSLDDLIVATDDLRISDHIKGFGGKVIMTSPHHSNGTERCGEVIEGIGKPFDFVINIQGDEPFIQPSQIDLLASILTPKTELATQVSFETDRKLFESPNEIKVVFNDDGRALYFSRSPIPKYKNWSDYQGFNKHIGLYAYRTDILQRIVQLSPSTLELAESLEQLRWLQAGFHIRIIETEETSLSIDTPEDLERVKALISLTSTK